MIDYSAVAVAAVVVVGLAAVWPVVMAVLKSKLASLRVPSPCPCHDMP